MSFEEKRVRQALGTPGKEYESSLYPPVGQLDFERIVGMDEQTLDRAFKERHGLDEVFARDKSGHHYDGTDIETVTRRLELKRIIFARLEGYSMSPNSILWTWYDEVTPGTYSGHEGLINIFSDYVNEECNKRIRRVQNRLAREAAVHHLTPEIAKLEKAIQLSLTHHGIEPLTVPQILNIAHLPPHAKVKDSISWDLAYVLKLYFDMCEGSTNEEIAGGRRLARRTLKTMVAQYFSDEAKAAVRKIRGWKVKSPKRAKTPR